MSNDEKKLKQAKSVYQSLCQMLDDLDWHYEKIEEDLAIKCKSQGDDLPIDIAIMVKSQIEIVTLLSPMPFSIPQNRRTALAVAVSRANNGLADGSFDYDYQSGNICFRLTSSYTGSLVSKEMLKYMLMCSCYMIDEYNDKFLVVAKTNMTNDEIVEFIK